MAIAAITAAELLVGVELADGRRRTSREAFVEETLEAVVIEDYDVSVASEHAKLLAHTSRTGTPRGAHDLIVAATAAATKRAVLSADVGAFEDLPGVALREIR